MESLNITIFKALAVEPRAKIVNLLSSRCLCAGALASLLKITPGAISQHLNVLKECGLVICERRGYYMHYRISSDAHKKALQALNALFENPETVLSKDKMCKQKCGCPKHNDKSGKALET